MSQALNAYQRQEVLNASPEQLILKIYDQCILECNRQKAEKVSQGLNLLINSLNFDYELSHDLYSLYEYCQRQVAKGELNEVKTIIEDLREAWAENVVPKKKKSGGTLNLNG